MPLCKKSSSLKSTLPHPILKGSAHTTERLNITTFVLFYKIGYNLSIKLWIVLKIWGNFMHITFNVRASEYVALDELRPFQGELKKLSEENHNKLRTEIIEDGFNFAPHLWLCDGKHYILDGHQRIYTLKQLAKEGYQFCKPNGDLLDGVPVNIVHATDIENAKRKVLQAVSQYGKLDDQGFKDFIVDVDFKMDNFDFPDFVLPSLDSPDVSDTVTGSKELDEDDFDNFDHTCPKCGFEWDDKK